MEFGLFGGDRPVDLLARPAPMPTASEGVHGLAAFWKTYYNTASGAGTAEQWVNNYNTYIVPAG